MTGGVAAGWAALLAGLPGMWPSLLGRLLDRWSPEEAWTRATSGRRAALGGAARGGASPSPPDALLARWALDRSGEVDGPAELARHRTAGVEVLLRDDPRYPLVLLEDPQPPPVLFASGGLDALAAPRVAIVGTRRCTGGGAAVARSLGQELAAAGVAVVSGLALGIDGAAHSGVLRATPDGDAVAGRAVGVIGCGHDRPYPKRHAHLWREVATRGLLIGEVPLGVGPEAWRFPLRNRVIAALADLVVVVESHDAGGSLVTVRAAIDRGRDVMAVPGSVRSPASRGTNQLLAEGCAPVRDADDVLVALGLQAGGRRGAADRRPAPDEVGRAVLDAFGWEPATLEQLALRTGHAIPTLALALERLESDGWVAGPGPWYERVGEP